MQQQNPYKHRGIFIVTHTAIWGVQSRYYDAAASAALFFQAEGLTLQGAGAATSTAAAGYSGTGENLLEAFAAGRLVSLGIAHGRPIPNHKSEMFSLPSQFNARTSCGEPV